MREQNNNKQKHYGEPARTSNQGRKFSTGGDNGKRGNPELNENTRATVQDMKKPRKRRS